LASTGLKINTIKSTFCSNELEYLGYLINRKGVRPTKKRWMHNIIDTNKTRKQLKSFVGMVN
jgi:hypothetical protein